MLCLENTEYPIYLSEDTSIFKLLLDLQSKYTSIHVICDSNTEQFCLPVLGKYIDKLNYHIHSFKAGESHKNFETVSQLYTSLLSADTDRRALIINLGGGVVGDLGGFVAATYKRGVDFIQVPTTLLAMVDATIGGKLGYNFEGVKNAVGVFANPLKVLICTEFLQTLPLDEKLSGWGEMLKHALISDNSYWEELCAFNISKEQIPIDFIYRSVEIKMNVVDSDPFEKGRRKLLNLGHTLGHAIESEALKRKQILPHGAAVAFGILGESYGAYNLGILSEIDFKKIVAYIQPLYSDYFSEQIDFQEVLKWIKNDKKNTSGKLNFTFLRKIGEAEFDQSLDIEHIREMVKWLNNIYEV